MPKPNLRDSQPHPRDALPSPRPEARGESPERRNTPTPNADDASSRRAADTLPADIQQGQQKSGGGDTSDPMRERHHVDPGRDYKPDYPKDPSR